MKKILTLIVLLTLVFCLSACLHTEKPTSSETHLPSSTDEPSALHADLSTKKPQIPTLSATEAQTETEQPTKITTETQMPTEHLTEKPTEKPTEITTESLSSSEPPPPVAPPSVVAMSFESVSDMYAFIKNPLNRLQNANEEMQKEYSEMCRNFVANGIYSVKSTTSPSTNYFVIYPLTKTEDRGIAYYFWYKEQVIQTIVYEMKALSSSTAQMESYAEERFGFEMENAGLPNNKELFLESPLLQVTTNAVWGKLDENHYLVVKADFPKELILEFMETLVIDKINLDEGLSENPNDSTVGICPPFHWFGSIRDLDTFITTGSTDPVDYQFRPLFGFAALESLALEDFADYQPIERYFSFNKNDFQTSKGGVGYENESPFVKYSYILDNVGISIHQVKADHISECYVRRESMNLSGEKITDYTSNTTLKRAHMLRKVADYDVIYYMEYGVIREVHFLIGNTYISVFSNIAYHDESEALFAEKVAKIQEEILTDPKYSCFAPLFSDDEKVFNSAIAKIAATK